MGASERGMLRVILVLVVVLLSGLATPGQGAEPNEVGPAVQTSRYVFAPEQSTIGQTGGFAGVNWTYTVEGRFCLSVDPDTGVASFANVDANAVDVGESARALDPDQVFNMTGLTGTVLDEATIEFAGRVADGSSVLLTLTFEEDAVYLTGETTPPRNSADFFVFSIDAVVTRKYAGGTGEPDDPFQIATATDLITLGESPEDWDKHFVLTADIDLSAYGGNDFNTIGYWTSDWDDREPFAGVFDGAGHTISNFSYEATDGASAGLFGYVRGYAADAEIRNVGLIDPNIVANGGSRVGSLVGYLAQGALENCWVQGGRIAGATQTGGLVGRSFGAVVTCYATTQVAGDSAVGGLVGDSDGLIANCYATSIVEGGGDVGGLAGRNWSGVVTNSYAAGPVTGDVQVGGLLGYDSGTVLSAFWNVETTGQTTSAGGTGVRTSQMQAAATFSLWGACDSDGVWTIDAGNDYPRLWWEDRPGQAITPVYLSSLLEGEGTEEDPYRIYTAAELNTVGLFPCEWDKQFKLMEDIDLSAHAGTAYNVIGCAGTWTWSRPFTGVFDGNDCAISNLRYRRQQIAPYGGFGHIGLFGYVADPNAEIRNVRLVDPNVDVPEGEYVGALVGYLRNGAVNNCTVQGGVVCGGSFVGGLMGRIGAHDADALHEWATVTDCGSSADVMGRDIAGGLAGGCLAGMVTRCWADAHVRAEAYVGGLLGCNKKGVATECYSKGHVTGLTGVGGLFGTTGICNCFCISSSSTMDCYSTAAVAGETAVGGLVGYNTWGRLHRCYSAGAVAGEESAGGLVGDNDTRRSGSVEASFWGIEASGQETSAAGKGLTTVEMQMASTFLEAGWDFVDETENGTEGIWWIDEGQGYPRLWWEVGAEASP